MRLLESHLLAVALGIAHCVMLSGFYILYTPVIHLYVILMPLAARPLGLKASFSFPGRILLLGLFLDLPLPFIGTSKASSVALGTLEAFSNHGQKLFGQKLGMSKIGFWPRSVLRFLTPSMVSFALCGTLFQWRYLFLHHLPAFSDLPSDILGKTWLARCFASLYVVCPLYCRH